MQINTKILDDILMKIKIEKTISDQMISQLNFIFSPKFIDNTFKLIDEMRVSLVKAQPRSYFFFVSKKFIIKKIKVEGYFLK